MKLMKTLEYLPPVAGIMLAILAFILRDFDYMLECMVALTVVSLLVMVIGYFSRRALERMRPCPPLSGFRIDLATYRCGEMTIGEPLTSVNDFFPDVSCEAVVKDEKQGFEMGLKDAVLDYVLLDLEHFPGLITRNGEPFPYLRFWDERRVIDELGEPYWRDEDADEVLLFYEDGRIELQIEFPGKKTARFVSILSNPILADAATRKAYRCNKPWPSEIQNF